MMEVDLMNSMNINIWGRDFELPVIIKQFKGKEITDTQKEAEAEFKVCGNIVNTVKSEVEKYILENGLKENGITEIDNIFKYVIPKSILIPKTKERVAAVMCNYKFDMEHGLAIVFENEELKDIGPQDIIL